MNRFPSLARHLALASALILPLAGCAEQQTGIGERLSAQIEKGMDKAIERIASEEFELSADGLPQASISPDGALSIDGKPVELSSQQQALVLAYRKQVQAIASDGVRIGMQGAELGVGAAASALSGALAGKDGAQIEAQIQEQAKDIKQAARQLCDHLPALHAASQAVSAAVPEFAPYATLDEQTADECRQQAG